MLTWRDGVVQCPEGAAREIPQAHAYSRSLWCTKDGSIRPRIYNFVSQTWTWEDLVPLTVHEDGRLGVRDFGIGTTGWTPLEVVIALAWRKRQPDSPMRASVEEGKPMQARFIRWAVEEDGDDAQRTMPGEVWKPLKWKVGLISCDGRGYKLSSLGRLKSPQGAITKGHFYDERRWAAVTGVGLVDLTTVAKLCPNVVVLPPAIKSAADAMYQGGVPPGHFANDAGIEVGTAWSYYTRAAQVLPVDRLRQVAKQFVARDLWRVLRQMEQEEDPVLGGSLTELMPEVLGRVSQQFVSSEFQWEQLRLARSAIARQQ